MPMSTAGHGSCRALALLAGGLPAIECSVDAFPAATLFAISGCVPRLWLQHSAARGVDDAGGAQPVPATQPGSGDAVQ